MDIRATVCEMRFAQVLTTPFSPNTAQAYSFAVESPFSIWSNEAAATRDMRHME